jgi:hypothetical protein
LDTDSFMIALKDELKPRLMSYGMHLDDIGLGEFNDTVIIGCEKIVLLIFGNIRCDGIEKDKQFQVRINPDKIENGDRKLVEQIAKDITKDMRASLGR